MKPLPGMSSLPQDAITGQLSRPFTSKKTVPALLGLWTRAGVFVGGDALSKVKGADHALVSPASRSLR